MRFRTIDGLRGIAALAVVLYHLNEAARITFDPWLPGWLVWVLKQGFLGVDIFFVLSGFVIAYSIRDAQPSGAYLGRFALRRSIRLDPPYWAAIALEIGVQWVAIRLALSDEPLPSIPQLLAHFVYLQNLLGLGDIVNIFWTLCFEIQFYLMLVSMLVVRERLRVHLGERATSYMSSVALALLFVLSVGVRFEIAGLSCHPGLALIRWYQFFMGACVWWVASGAVRPGVVVGTWATLVAAIAWKGAPPQQAIPIVISGLIWWSYRRDRMATLFSGRALQFLGAISYSLYLFHTTIGWRTVRVAGRLLGPDVSPLVAVAVYLLGVVLCLAAAWAAWRLLERPSLALGHRIALPRRAPSEPPAATGSGTARAPAAPDVP